MCEVNKNVGLYLKVKTYGFVNEVTTKLIRFHYKSVLKSLQKCATFTTKLCSFCV